MAMRNGMRQCMRTMSVLGRMNAMRPGMMMMRSGLASASASASGNMINSGYRGTAMETRRFYSVIENGLAAPVVEFDKMKEIVRDVENGNDEYVIVDVRENDEFASGHIRNAINLPCKSSPGALGLDPEEFKLTFGFDKPGNDKTLVFYCLAGVRATISEELASTFDYEKRLNYSGSFRDWISNNGEVVKEEEVKKDGENVETESK